MKLSGGSIIVNLLKTTLILFILISTSAGCTNEPTTKSLLEDVLDSLAVTSVDASICRAKLESDPTSDHTKDVCEKFDARYRTVYIENRDWYETLDAKAKAEYFKKSKNEFVFLNYFENIEKAADSYANPEAQDAVTVATTESMLDDMSGNLVRIELEGDSCKSYIKDSPIPDLTKLSCERFGILYRTEYRQDRNWYKTLDAGEKTKFFRDYIDESVFLSYFEKIEKTAVAISYTEYSYVLEK